MDTAAELRHIIKDCGAKVALIGEELFENARPLLGEALDHVIVARYADYMDEATDLPLPAVLTEVAHDLDARPEFFATVPPRAVRWHAAIEAGQKPSAHVISAEDLAVIPYTSGTTGAPKGCMHTHRAANHVVAASVRWCHLSSDSVVLCSMPMFHVTGMQHTMNVAIFLGATMVVMTRWNSHCAAQLIERHRVSYWSAISTMMIDFMSVPDLDCFDLSSLEIVGGGGAAMPKVLAQRMAGTFGRPLFGGVWVVRNHWCDASQPSAALQAAVFGYSDSGHGLDCGRSHNVRGPRYAFNG
jgi:fatty-acyl-CoA synthase